MRDVGPDGVTEVRYGELLWRAVRRRRWLVLIVSALVLIAGCGSGTPPDEWEMCVAVDEARDHGATLLDLVDPTLESVTRTGVREGLPHPGYDAVFDYFRFRPPGRKFPDRAGQKG